MREYDKQRYIEKRDEIIDKVKKYQKDNKEKYKESQKKSYQKNLEKNRAKSREWYYKNKLLIDNSEYQKKYYQEHKEELREIHKKYYQEHKAELKIKRQERDKMQGYSTQKRYYQEHRDEILAKAKEKRMRAKENADGNNKG